MYYVYKLAKGYFISILMFLLFTGAAALLIKVTSMPEAFSFYYILAALSISSLFLGIFSGALIGKNGLLSAAGLSAVFVFLVIFTINCAYFQELSVEMLNPLYMIPVLIGGIGGIIGVNAKK